MWLIRSVLFYVGYACATIIWGSLSVLIAWALPYRARFAFIAIWTRISLWWLRLTCNIDHRIEGLEHLPGTPCIVLCHHESSWETLLLMTLFVPQATLIKRELLHIPFFGWAFRLLRPIAIDRRDARSALKKLIRLGRDRLNEGIWVVLFPEGTRMPAGQLGRFQAGGAALASATNTPVLVVAHSGGSCWPARQFRKYPGTIRLKIAPPIETANRRAKVINEEAAAVMGRLLNEIREQDPDVASIPSSELPSRL